MIYNVAQLLKSPVGMTMDVDLDNDDKLELHDEEAQLAGPITGHVRLHHTNQGIYAEGTAHVPVRLECARCLKSFTTTLALPLREEYYPTIDIETGLPTRLPENEAAFPIDAHHQVDLREAIRQNLVVNLPTQALCREDCQGLCAVCGKDLNAEPHTHAEEVEDERFASLRGLFEK
jgi:uncharacterized protein